MADAMYPALVVTKADAFQMKSDDIPTGDQVVQLAPGLTFHDLPLIFAHLVGHLHGADGKCHKRRAGPCCGDDALVTENLNELPRVPHVPTTPGRILSVAADLLSDDGENPEYDRAIKELVGDLLGFTADEYPIVEQTLRLIHSQRRVRG